MDADVRQVPASRENTLADIEGSGQPNSFDRDVHTFAPRQIHHPLHGVPIGTID